MKTKVYIEQGDITTYKVDAIVNAANNDLILGGGLAGAIAKKGGPKIQEECNKIGPIEVGGAAITTAGNLPAKYVIHAASMRLGSRTRADKLESSVRNSLKIAEEHKLKSIAFPAIGTGIGGFPIEECANIMIRCVLDHIKSNPNTSLEAVYFVLYDPHSYEIFKETLERLEKTQEG